jgi:DNA-binding response OmpR family regulator
MRGAGGASCRPHDGAPARREPYGAIKTPQGSARASGLAPRLRGVKALIVEDDAKVARLLSRVLQEEGFVVDTCASAADAITYGGSLSYDLMVLDWMLPEGSGPRRLPHAAAPGDQRADHHAHGARARWPSGVLGLEAGADDYLCKPFHVDEFLARVHAVLRRSQGTVSRFVVGPLEIDRPRRAATPARRPTGPHRPRVHAAGVPRAARGARW